MSKVNTLIAERLKKNPQNSKMAEMAKQSVNGNLSGFSGIFAVSDLSVQEKKHLESILIEYTHEPKNLAEDLETLIAITSEVKAINNQATILHGERIKKAHAILTLYRDGAFTAWLVAAYGNRQTPYNFLQYYQLYELMPRQLRMKLETMPRQAIYTLASRIGSLELKQKFIENYQSQTKTELLEAIRETFPLSENDKRRVDFGRNVIQSLERIQNNLKRKRKILTKNQVQIIQKILENINIQIQEIS
jgi:hypothetical protein